MKEVQRVDVAIAVIAAEFTLTENQRELLDRHQEVFGQKVGSLDPGSQAAKNIYFETMDEVEGVQEVYELLDQLTDFNLSRLMDYPKM